MLKKIIWIAVGLVLTVGVTMGIVHYTNTGERSMETSMSQVGEYLSDNADIMLSKYKQGGTATGEELRNLCSGITQSGVTINVVTGNLKGGAGTTGTYTKTAKYDLTTDKYSASYINPSRTFKCTANTTDGNGVITSLTFTQQ